MTTTSEYSFTDVLEPVYVKNSETLIEKWLKVKEGTEMRSAKEIMENIVPSLKTITFELLDSSMYKCKRCGATVKGGEKPPTDCLSCSRPSTFDTVTDSIDIQKNLWKLPIWKDIDLDMFNTYLDIIKVLKKTIKFVEEIQYKIFALWIIATYKHPLWNTIPYLHFKGLPASGKTRAMEMAKLLSYRSVMVSGITFTAIVRVNHVFNVTLLIDEIDSKLDERTEVGREYVDFLKSGYKKGSQYITSDLNDQKRVIYYNNYGPKILTGEKGIYSEALLSRTISFEMEQDYPEVMDLDEVSLDCEVIKTQLLNYRFKTSTPDFLGSEIPLRARYREIFDCLIRTAQHIGQTTDDILKYAKDLEDEAVNNLQGTVQWEILKIIRELSVQGVLDAPEEIKLNRVLEGLGWDDEPKKNGQKLGNILKNLGLKTKRKKDGTWLSLVDPKNNRKLDYLYKRYKTIDD